MENVSQPCAKATWLVLYKAGMQLMRKAGPAAFANSWGIAYLELNRQSLVSVVLSMEHDTRSSVYLIETSNFFHSYMATTSS